MSGAVSGVQARILQEAPLAVYTHCSNHALNIAIGHSCRLPDVRNMIDKLKETTMFLATVQTTMPCWKTSQKQVFHLTVLNDRHF